MTDPLELIYPDVRARMRCVYASMLAVHKVQMRCCQGGRSYAYQEQLYQQGRSTPGPIVTLARGGESLHNFYLAVDSCFDGTDPFLDHSPKLQYLWDEYAKYVRGNGLVSGADFMAIHDRPHAQLSYGLTLGNLQKLYDFGKLEAVWTKIDQIRGVSCEWEKVRHQIQAL